MKSPISTPLTWYFVGGLLIIIKTQSWLIGIGLFLLVIGLIVESVGMMNHVKKSKARPDKTIVRSMNPKEQRH